MSIIKNSLLFIIIFISAVTSHALLWRSTQFWSTEWEKKYETWISQSIDKDFFLNANFETDCADAVIALRVIFARDHQLPFAFTSANGGVLTNLSSYFNDSVDLSVPWHKDQKFRSNLQYILDFTSSRTLINDAYPIALSSKSIRPGVFFIHKFESSGHVDFVHQVILNGQIMPIRMLSSTVPKKSRQLQEYPFYFISNPEKSKTGFFKFKWAVEKNGQVTLSQALTYPDYSLEQYQGQSTAHFDDIVNSKILGQKLSSFSKVFDLFQILNSKINERVTIVQAGYRACSRQNCNENSSHYYNYSTPSRDGNIHYILMQLEQAFADAAQTPAFAEVSELYVEYLKASYSITPERTLQLAEIIENWKNVSYSSDPRDSILKRWGI